MKSDKNRKSPASVWSRENPASVWSWGGGSEDTQERKSRAELYPLVSRGPDFVSSYQSVGGVERSCKGLV